MAKIVSIFFIMTLRKLCMCLSMTSFVSSVNSHILMGKCKKDNSIANGLELSLSCTNPSIYLFKQNGKILFSHECLIVTDLVACDIIKSCLIPSVA